ncbi:hypothetical protein CR973_02785 [Candidatus Saccharibacteria bacterium]|nr:MAG: hypothetical protein CR973_02785 [Candidatus Saccharibacteria bacterium]
MSENKQTKKPWYKSLERGPLVVAWVQLASVWMLAFIASRIAADERAESAVLERAGDIVALISYLQFFTGMLYLFLYPHTSLRKRLLIFTALFLSLVVIIATKQGVVGQ